MDNFKNYLKLVYDKNKFEFYSEEYLIDFNNYFNIFKLIEFNFILKFDC